MALKKFFGENLLGLCPMHEDHDPSLVLTPSRGLWHCLGACQIGGTVIDWVMKAEGLDFREAVDKLLAEFFPLEAASLVRRAAVTEQACPLDLDADDQALLNQYADFCHELFRTTAEPKEYVAKRGISSDELVSHFKLGYANRTLGLRLPNVKSKAGLTLRTRLPGPRRPESLGPRAPRGLSRYPDQGQRWQRHGHVRAQDPQRPPDRHARSSVPARTAPRRLQRRGLRSREDDHPHGVAHRRAVFLGERASGTSPVLMAWRASPRRSSAPSLSTRSSAAT